MVVMNTKQSSLAVYHEVSKKTTGEYKVYYLSTRLYAAHRKEVIAEIRKALLHKEKIIVVSTQLIEAGIDFDFSCVIRALAGKDSIVQRREDVTEREKKKFVRRTLSIPMKNWNCWHL